jgi:hypothetical protein
MRVDLRMSDDAGWYATYSQFFFRSLDGHFDEIEADVRKALNLG